MNEKLTFQHCLSYLYALKKTCFYFQAKGHNLPEAPPQYGPNLAVVITSAKRQMIVIPQKQGLVSYQFVQEKFAKKELLPSYSPYQNQYYEFSVYEANTRQLLLLLESTDQAYETVHKDIDFRLGLRLYKKFTTSSEVHSVILRWPNGMILLCTKRKGKDLLLLSDAKKEIKNSDALERIQQQYAQELCDLEILRQPGTEQTKLPQSPSLTKIAPSSSVKEESVITTDKPLPTLQPQDREVLERYGISVQEDAQGRAQVNEESVVVSDKELPSLRPEDREVLDKYGVEIREKQQKPQQQDKQEQSVIIHDQELPLLSPEDQTVLEKYGIEIREHGSKQKGENQEVSEKSVVMKDHSLPLLNPEDRTVLEKYGISIVDKDHQEATQDLIFEESQIPLKHKRREGPGGQAEEAHFVLEESQLPLDQKVSLGNDTRRVLQKYNINFEEEKEATVNDFRASFEGSSLDEFPSLNEKDIDVLKKYGIAVEKQPGSKKKKSQKTIKDELSTTGRAQPSQGIVPAADLEVFQRYGFHLEPNQPYALVDIHRKFREACDKGEIHLPISRKDRLIFKKYTLDPPKESVRDKIEKGKQKISPWAKKVQPRYLIIAASLVLCFYLLTLLFGIYQKYREEQQRITACQNQIETFVVFKEEVQSQVQKIEEILATLSTEYPSHLGYPEANPKIPKKINKIAKQVRPINQVIEQARANLENGNIEVALEKLRENENQKSTELLKTLANLEAKAKRTLKVAKNAYLLRQQDMLVRRVLRKLREHEVGFSQKLKPLEEAITTMRELYPASKGYPEVPEQATTMVQKYREKIPQLNEAINKIQRALDNDNALEALSLSKPYASLESPDFSGLEEITARVRTMVEESRLKAFKKAKQQAYDLLADQLKERKNALAEQIHSIEQHRSQLDKLRETLNLAGMDSQQQQIFKQAQAEKQQLAQTLIQAEQQFEQQKYESALHSLEKAVAEESQLASLRQIQENLQDILALAEKEKVRRNQESLFSELLREAKGTQLSLEEGISNLQQKMARVQENFPTNQGFPQLPGKYQTVITQSQEIFQELTQMLHQASVAQSQDLSKAITLLQKSQGVVKRANLWLEETKESLESLDQFIKRCEKIRRDKQRSLKEREIDSLLQTLSDRIQLLKNEQSKLAQSLNTLQNFPQAEVSARVYSIQTEVEKKLTSLQQIQQQGRKLLQQKKYSQAIERLSSYDYSNNILVLIHQAQDEVTKALEFARGQQQINEQEKQLAQKIREIESTLLPLANNVAVLSSRIDFVEQNFTNKSYLPKLQGSYYRVLSAGRNFQQQLETLLQQTREQVATIKTQESNKKETALKNLIQQLNNKTALVTSASKYRSRTEKAIRGVESFIDRCEEMIEQRIEQAKQQEVTELRNNLTRQKEDLQQELVLLNKSLQKLASFPVAKSDLLVPDPRADKVAEQARERIQKIEEVLQKNASPTPSELESTLETLREQITKGSVLTLIRQVKENILDTIERAQDIQKRREQQQQITQLMQAAREDLLPLEEKSKDLANKITQIKSEFVPQQGFPSLPSKYSRLLNEAQLITGRINDNLTNAKQDIGQGKIAQAIALMRKSTSVVSEAERILPIITRAANELGTYIKKASQIKQARAKLSQINQQLQKIQDYLADLREQLQPMEQHLSQIEKEFAKSITDSNSSVQQAKDKQQQARTVQRKLEKLLQKTLRLRKSKKYDLALETLRNQAQLDRDLIAVVTKLRYELHDLIRESRMLSKHRQDVEEIKSILSQLSERRQELESYMRKFPAALASFRQEYPATGVYVSPPDTTTYLKQGKTRSEELADVIEEGEEALHSARYDRALSLLRPFLKETPYLPVLQSVWTQIEKAIETNERIKNDPEFRKKKQRQQEKEEKIKKLRPTWRRSPGPWYDQLQNFLTTFEQQQRRISLTIDDSGARNQMIGVVNFVEKLTEYPSRVADLEEVIFRVNYKGGNIEAELKKREDAAITFGQREQYQHALHYLRNKTIPLDAQKDIQEILRHFSRLQDELSQRNIQEDTLQDLKGALRTVHRAFNEKYQDIFSAYNNVELELSSH